MQTRPRAESRLFNPPLTPPRTRGVGTQVVPYADHMAFASHGFLASSSRQGIHHANQINLYANFQLDILAQLGPERTQDLMKASSPVVKGAINAYISRTSTKLKLTPDLEELEIFRPLVESHQLKQTFDQIFGSLFKRGAAAYELMLKKMGKYWVPIRFDVHDPARFELILVSDPEIEGAQKYQLYKKSMFGNLQPVNDETVQYVAWRPEVNWYETDAQGSKPYGESRLTSTFYYNTILVQTIKLVTKILSKQGTPVLPITIDYEKLFDKNGNSIIRGDIQEYIKNKSRELQAQIKGLSENDALILTGECVLGDYMSSATNPNLTGLEAYIDRNIDLILLGMGVPPVEVGRIIKSGSLNDNSSSYMQMKFGRDCRSDQELVASYLLTLLKYVLTLNRLKTSQPLEVDFEYRNAEEELQNSEIHLKNMETFKAEGEDLQMMLENADRLAEKLDWSDKKKKEWIEMELQRRKANDAFAPVYA